MTRSVFNCLRTAGFPFLLGSVVVSAGVLIAQSGSRAAETLAPGSADTGKFVAEPGSNGIAPDGQGLGGGWAAVGSVRPNISAAPADTVAASHVAAGHSASTGTATSLPSPAGHVAADGGLIAPDGFRPIGAVAAAMATTGVQVTPPPVSAMQTRFTPLEVHTVELPASRPLTLAPTQAIGASALLVAPVQVAAPSYPLFTMKAGDSLKDALCSWFAAIHVDFQWQALSSTPGRLRDFQMDGPYRYQPKDPSDLLNHALMGFGLTADLINSGAGNSFVIKNLDTVADQ